MTSSSQRSAVTIVGACFGGLPERQSLVDLSVPGVKIVLLDERVGLVQGLLAVAPRAVVFPPVDFQRNECAPLIERVRVDAGDVMPAILVRSGAEARGITSAMRAGATLCTWATQEDIAAAIFKLSGVAGAVADRPALVALVGDLRPAACVDVLLVCAEKSEMHLTVVRLAAIMKRSRRSLSRLMRLSGWPPPSELIEWGRLLCASLVQWREERGVSALASASGFVGPEALRRCATRLLGEGTALPASLTPLKVATALRRRLDGVSRVVSV